MIKIEKMLDGCVASISRNGARLELYTGLLIGEKELESLRVHSGKLIYTRAESEVVEVSAPTMPKVVKVVKPQVQKNG